MNEGLRKVPPEVAYADYIEKAAGYLLEGLNPQALTGQGRIEEAHDLGFILGRIMDKKLGGFLERRVESLRAEREVQESGRLSSQDLERGINLLHNQHKKYRLGEILRGDASYEVRQKRKAWRVGKKDKADLMRYKLEDAIEELKAAGVWKYLEGGVWNSQVISLVRAKLRAYRGRDLDSSEGITIYPDEESMLADIFDSE